MDDGKILALLFARDEQALSFIAAKYGGLCSSIIANILKDKRDVEECISNVYIKLWQSIPPAEPKNLKAYIAKTARNEALMRLRSAKNKLETEALPFEELEAVLPHIETEAETGELRDAIERFLKEQPYEKRVVFMRRYWFFDSIEDISHRLGITKSKAASMLFRLRNELKRALEKEELI